MVRALRDAVEPQVEPGLADGGAQAQHDRTLAAGDPRGLGELRTGLIRGRCIGGQHRLAEHPQHLGAPG